MDDATSHPEFWIAQVIFWLPMVAFALAGILMVLDVDVRLWGNRRWDRP